MRNDVTRQEDDLRPEYDASELKGGVRGKYLDRFRAGTNLALLAPDVRSETSMAEITLVVTQRALHHINRGNLDQSQIAIRGASADIAPAIRGLTRDNRIPVSLGGCITLSFGDPGAIWRVHNVDRLEDYDALFGLLSRRPDQGMRFLCEVPASG